MADHYKVNRHRIKKHSLLIKREFGHETIPGQPCSFHIGFKYIASTVVIATSSKRTSQDHDKPTAPVLPPTFVLTGIRSSKLIMLISLITVDSQFILLQCDVTSEHRIANTPVAGGWPLHGVWTSLDGILDVKCTFAASDIDVL